MKQELLLAETANMHSLTTVFSPKDSSGFFFYIPSNCFLPIKAILGYILKLNYHKTHYGLQTLYT